MLVTIVVTDDISLMLTIVVLVDELENALDVELDRLNVLVREEIVPGVVSKVVPRVVAEVATYFLL